MNSNGSAKEIFLAEAESVADRALCDFISKQDCTKYCIHDSFRESYCRECCGLMTFNVLREEN